MHRGVPPQSRHLKNSYASETPATDGSASTRCSATSACSPTRWTARWRGSDGGRRARRATAGARPRPRCCTTAGSTSLDDNEEDASLTALDAASGQGGLARQPPEGDQLGDAVHLASRRSEPKSWSRRRAACSPTISKAACCGRSAVCPRIAIPTPFESGGLLYVASGYVGDKVRPVYAIRPGAAGDISLTGEATSKQFVAWTLPQAAPYNPSPIVYDGIYYTLLDRGFSPRTMPAPAGRCTAGSGSIRSAPVSPLRRGRPTAGSTC